MKRPIPRRGAVHAVQLWRASRTAPRAGYPHSFRRGNGGDGAECASEVAGWGGEKQPPDQRGTTSRRSSTRHHPAPAWPSLCGLNTGPCPPTPTPGLRPVSPHLNSPRSSTSSSCAHSHRKAPVRLRMHASGSVGSAWAPGAAASHRVVDSRSSRPPLEHLAVGEGPGRDRPSRTQI
jgi:hypothetical protein